MTTWKEENEADYEKLAIWGNNIEHEESESDEWKKKLKLVKKLSFFPEITQVGDRAACYATSLEIVKIPEGIESIGCAAFFKCKKLRKVKFPTTLKFIKAKAFSV